MCISARSGGSRIDDAVRRRSQSFAQKLCRREPVTPSTPIYWQNGADADMDNSVVSIVFTPKRLKEARNLSQRLGRHCCEAPSGWPAIRLRGRTTTLTVRRALRVGKGGTGKVVHGFLFRPSPQIQHLVAQTSACL